MNTPLESCAQSPPPDAGGPVMALVESLLRWEDAPQDAHAMQDAMAHLKRLAELPAVGQDADLAQAVHLGQQALSAIQQCGGQSPPATIDALLELAQCLSEILQAPRSSRRLSAWPIVQRLQAMVPATGQAETSKAEPPPACPGIAALEWPAPAQGLSVELVAQFKTESYENLEQVERALLVLEKSPQDTAALNEAFRGIHNIKGAAKYVGLKQLGTLAHGIEDVLDQARAGRRTWEPAVADLVLRAVDELRRMTDALEGPEEPARDLSGLMAELRATTGGAPRAAAAQSAESGASTSAVLWSSAEQQVEAIAGCTERLLAGSATDSVWATLHRAAATLQAAAQAVGDLELAGAARRLGQQTLRVMEQRATLRDKANGMAEAQTRSAILRWLEGDASEAALEALGQVRPDVRGAIDLFRTQRAGCAAQWQAKQQEAAGPAPLGAPTTAVAAEHTSPDAGASSTASQAGPAGKSPKTASAVRGGREEPAARSLRVDQRKLDEYVNLAGELVIARNALAHEFRQAGLNPTQHRRLKESIDRVDRIVADIQANAMSMRMVPVATLFQRFPRMVRDIARSLEKQIELRTVGEETEVDKQVAERLADPLVHLVRNAADHGIEPPHVRRAAGKPETGVITLRAGREGNLIVIEVVDDGGGIAAERLKAKAVEKGLIGASQAAAMSRQEALQLVFAAGLSTAAAVSDLSGRGVGMDVVRNNLAELGGTVTVFSEPGQGSRFRLELPLTLAVTNVLLAALDDATYAIPIDAVQETLKVAVAQLQRVNQQWVMPLRNQIVPVKPLKTLLGHRRGHATVGHGCLAASDSPAPREPHAGRSEPRPVVVVRRAGCPYGLMVDRLLGQQEIVIKPLPGHLARAPGISGAAILGDGQVALILDPARLAC